MIYGNKINPERLKEARLFQKMTLEDLAIAVGINKQAISQFENRKASPDPMTLKRIADVLHFPYTFFFENDPAAITGNTYFRALYSSKKKDLVSQQVKAKYLARIHSILATKVRFIESNLPCIPTEPQISIEECAMRVRQH